MFTVRAATPKDAGAWLRLRRDLWPDGADGHAAEIASYFAGEFPRWPWQVLLAEDEAGAVVGMAEVSVRPYAEGCVSCAVTYLEGWYVAPDVRRKGVGRLLLHASAEWGRARGCTEFAADTALENVASAAALTAAGLDEVESVRCFRMDL